MDEKTIFSAINAFQTKANDLPDGEYLLVNVEEPESGKLLQISAWDDGHLIMDIALSALTGDEANATFTFFRQYCDDPIEVMPIEDPETGRLSYLLAFQHDFGQNARAVAKATIAFFQEVYEFPATTRLKISGS